MCVMGDSTHYRTIFDSSCHQANARFEYDEHMLTLSITLSKGQMENMRVFIHSNLRYVGNPMVGLFMGLLVDKSEID